MNDESTPPPNTSGGRKKKKSGDDDAPNEPTSEGWTNHPLFPGLDGSRAFSSIRVVRFRARDAAWLTAPRSFRPDELSDLSAVQDMFGGGRYELWALNAKAQIVTKHLWVLDGEEKPFPGVGAPPAPAPAAAPAVGGIGGTDLVPLMLQLMTNQSAAQLQAARDDARAREQSGQQFMVMMMGMFEKISNRPDTLTPLLSALAPIAAPLVERLATPSKQSGFKELIEVAQLISGAKARVDAGESSAEGEMKSLADSISTLMAGFATMKQADIAAKEVDVKAKEVEANVAVAKANAEATRNLAHLGGNGVPPPSTPPPAPPASAPPRAVAAS